MSREIDAIRPVRAFLCLVMGLFVVILLVWQTNRGNYGWAFFDAAWASWWFIEALRAVGGERGKHG